MIKEFTSKELEQVKQDLARKGITLETIEYFEKPLGDNETYTKVYVNNLYECILRKGNNRWYEKRYTTKRQTKTYKEIVTADAINYKKVSA